MSQHFSESHALINSICRRNPAIEDVRFLSGKLRLKSLNDVAVTPLEFIRNEVDALWALAKRISTMVFEHFIQLFSFNKEAFKEFGRDIVAIIDLTLVSVVLLPFLTLVKTVQRIASVLIHPAASYRRYSMNDLNSLSNEMVSNNSELTNSFQSTFQKAFQTGFAESLQKGFAESFQKGFAESFQKSFDEAFQ